MIKVLLKADGMPTYHLAVVVDDYLMKITTCIPRRRMAIQCTGAYFIMGIFIRER